MRWASVIFFVVASVQFSYYGIFASGALNKDENHCDDVNKYPIDLPADAALATYGNIKFTGFQYSYKAKLIIADGIPEYHYNGSKHILVSEGGLKGVYYLHKGRYINPAKHTVAGARYIAEAHFVCVNTKYKNYETAREHPDGLAILVVFVMIGTKDNPAYNQFLDALRNVKGDPPSYELPLRVSPSSALPENRCSFFRYRGRYSHRSCKETATWIVFTDPVQITEEQQSKMADELLTLHDKFDVDVTKDEEYLRTIDIHDFKFTRKNIVTLQPRIFCKSLVSSKDGFPWFLFHKII